MLDLLNLLIFFFFQRVFRFSCTSIMNWKVLIIDDHPIVREGVAAILPAEEFQVIGCCGTIREATELLRHASPHVVMLDVRLRNEDGFAAIAAIRKTLPTAKFVIFSSYDNPTYLARAVALDVQDYLAKSATRESITTAMRRCVMDAPPLDCSPLLKIAAVMRRKDICDTGKKLPLTNREIQVLRHLGLGLSNKEAASSLCVSVETIKEHVQNILRKLNVPDRTAAAVMAVKNGLV